jgi:hypothetical protein
MMATNVTSVAPPAPFIDNALWQRYMFYRQQVVADVATACAYNSIGMAASTVPSGFPNQLDLQVLKNGAAINSHNGSFKSDNFRVTSEDDWLQQYMLCQQSAGLVSKFPNQPVLQVKNEASAAIIPSAVLPGTNNGSIKTDNFHTGTTNVTSCTDNLEPVASSLITPGELFCLPTSLQTTAFRFSEHTSEDWLKANENIGIGHDQYVVDQETRGEGRYQSLG